MTMKKITTILLIISDVILVLAIALNLNLINLKFNNKTNLLNDLEDNNCSELDVFITSECLNKQLKTWYKYNLSNTGKDLSFEKLKEEGGICRHFSDFYKQSFLNLGAVELTNQELKFIRRNDSKVYVTEVIIPSDSKTNHVFLMVSGKNGECKLDNELINCWEFKNV